MKLQNKEYKKTQHKNHKISSAHKAYWDSVHFKKLPHFSFIVDNIFTFNFELKCFFLQIIVISYNKNFFGSNMQSTRLTFPLSCIDQSSQPVKFLHNIQACTLHIAHPPALESAVVSSQISFYFGFFQNSSAFYSLEIDFKVVP